MTLTLVFLIIIVLDFGQGNEQPSNQLDLIPSQFTSFHYRDPEIFLQGQTF